jgi:hypothetical protein
MTPDNDDKLVLKERAVKMDDGSIRTFWSREKRRFVDNNGLECVVLEVFDPNARYESAAVMEITGSVIHSAS